MSADVLGPPSPGERPPAALTRPQVREAVAHAVALVDGLSLLLPLRKEALRLAGGGEALAVSVSEDVVEVRLVAHRLPLPPLLERVGGHARAALAGTRWADVPLRLVVAELSQAALDDR